MIGAKNMKDFDKIGISRRLAELREKKGIKQKDVAIGTNITQSNIAKYETNQRTPSIPDVIALANYYDTTTDYILTGISADNRNINKVTGLSENSLKFLEMIQYGINNNIDAPFHKTVINTLNSILDINNTYINNRFFPTGWYLISAIGEFLNTDFNINKKETIKFQSISRYGEKMVIRSANALENICTSNIIGLLKSIKKNIFDE